MDHIQNVIYLLALHVQQNPREVCPDAIFCTESILKIFKVLFFFLTLRRVRRANLWHSRQPNLHLKGGGEGVGGGGIELLDTFWYLMWGVGKTASSLPIVFFIILVQWLLLSLVTLLSFFVSRIFVYAEGRQNSVMLPKIPKIGRIMNLYVPIRMFFFFSWTHPNSHLNSRCMCPSPVMLGR